MTLAHQLEEVMKLVAETGDRCIVLRENHDPMVVMDVVSYRRLLTAAAGKEKLATMTEEELLSKINQDIAEWRELRQDESAEYDLTQFRVDEEDEPEERIPEPRTTYSRPTPAIQHESDVENLPIVDEDEDSEYQLEPID